jgi:hypothetical protein
VRHLEQQLPPQLLARLTVGLLWIRVRHVEAKIDDHFFRRGWIR